MTDLTIGKTPTEFEDWCRVFEEHHHKLFKYARKLTRDTEEAEDLVHDVFCRILDNRSGRSGVDYKLNYLYVTIKNDFLDRLRSGSRSPHVVLSDKQTVESEAAFVDQRSSADIENRLYHKELMGAIPWQMVLKGLTDFETKVLFMYCVDEMNYRQIAKETAQDPTKVRYDIQRMMAKLRYRAQKLLVAYNRTSLFSRDDSSSKNIIVPIRARRSRATSTPLSEKKVIFERRAA